MTEYLETTYDKFLFRVKKGNFYSRDEFWADIRDSVATVGVTDFLQKASGDITYLVTVEPGTTVRQGEGMGRMETIKAALDLISPVEGTVLEVNPEMETSPHLINLDPYEKGWIYRIKVSDPDRVKLLLLSARDYFELMKQKIQGEAEKLRG
jgi:glycine cleavage system H protein